VGQLFISVLAHAGERAGKSGRQQGVIGRRAPVFADELWIEQSIHDYGDCSDGFRIGLSGGREGAGGSPNHICHHRRYSKFHCDLRHKQTILQPPVLQVDQCRFCRCALRRHGTSPSLVAQT
jgi:hypothetical protein